MKLIALLGVVALSVPFLSALSSGPPSDDAELHAGAPAVDLSDLAPGEVLELTWAGGRVWVYHRTPEELAALGRSGPHLRDPASADSAQPEAVRNSTRSLHSSFFVFLPEEGLRGCAVRLDRGSGPRGNAQTFTEACFGARYDAAGRVHADSGDPRQVNLTVPPHEFLSDGRLRLGAWSPSL